MRQAVGYPLRDFFKGMYDPLIEEARTLVADHAEVWQHGRSMSIDEAISLALGEA
jgi:hypothetical protein